MQIVTLTDSCKQPHFCIKKCYRAIWQNCYLISSI